MKKLDGIQILLVDDNEDNLELLQLSLEMEGAHVKGAASATAALERVNQSIPDVLVSDLTLPDEDGCALLARLRTLPGLGDLPAVAVTGHSDSTQRERAQRAGFGAYVVKPVELAQLTLEISKLVRAHRVAAS